MRLALHIPFLALAVAVASCGSQDAAKRELTPAGVLRVALAVGPQLSASFAVSDGTGLSYRGVPVDLGRALAEKLGVSVVFIPYRSSGEITDAAAQNAWDVAFLPVDDERKKQLDFASAYHVLQSTYLVTATSPVQTIAQVNASGMRVVAIDNTATMRASQKASRRAMHIPVKGIDEAVVMIQNGEADAIALSREALEGLLPRLPGARILDGGFLNSTTALAVRRDHQAGRDYARAFLEDLKSAGEVRRILDRYGLQTSVVAPAGFEP